MSRRMNGKKVLEYLLSFLIMLQGTIILVCSSTYMGFFDYQIILRSLQESGYYQENYNKFTENTKIFLKNTDIPIEVVTDILQLDKFYASGREAVVKVLNGQSNMEYDQIYHSVYEAILDYLDENSSESNDSKVTEASKLTKKIVQVYQELIENHLVKELMQQKAYLKTRIIRMVLTLMMSGLVSCFILWKLVKYKHRAVEWMSYAAYGGSGLSLFINWNMIRGMTYSSQLPDYYSHLLEVYISFGLKRTMYICALGFFLAFLLWIVASFMRGKLIGDKYYGTG